MSVEIINDDVSDEAEKASFESPFLFAFPEMAALFSADKFGIF